jgi:hypothetical protein
VITSAMISHEHQASPAIRAEVLAIEAKRVKALLDHDMDGLARLLAEDLVYIHSNGTIDDKASFLERKSNVRYTRFDQIDPVVRAYGDVAIINVLTDVTVASSTGGGNIIKLWSSNVWSRASGTWLQVLWHCTRIPADNPK